MRLALEQPDGLGFDWSSLIAPTIQGLTSVTGTIVGAKIQSDAITKQIQAQTQAQVQTAAYNAQAAQAQAAAASPLTQTIGATLSNPIALIALAVGGFLLLRK